MQEMTRSMGCPNIYHMNSNVQPTEMFNFTDSNVIKYSNNRCFQKPCSEMQNYGEIQICSQTEEDGVYKVKF